MPRPKRPSETCKPPAGLTDDQAAAMKALSGDCLYATVGGGCRVVRVEEIGPLNPDALRALEALGLVELVELWVYQKRGN